MADVALSCNSGNQFDAVSGVCNLTISFETAQKLDHYFTLALAVPNSTKFTHPYWCGVVVRLSVKVWNAKRELHVTLANNSQRGTNNDQMLVANPVTRQFKRLFTGARGPVPRDSTIVITGKKDNIVGA